MTQVISALKARNQFGRILKAATEKRGRFIVERRGEPSVVIRSLEDFASTFAPQPQEMRRLQRSAVKTGSSLLTPAQINREIRAARKQVAR